MKRYIKVLAFLFMIGLVACEYDYIVEKTPTPEPDPDNPISFATQVEPIFQTTCIGCHDSRNPILVTGAAYDNLINGNYINTDNPAESKVYKKATDGHGKNMGSKDRLTLLTWITEGAKDN
ncbi:hypothetical protein EV201_1888 [Ancylomarina subtilis]|uniref:Cytochrome c domain-containing protein n=1 Tax=Ancylomarina subtilis TaxID=1639035 RepID=A0A4Q7VLU8_9BACT|nr:hypothetical protein [Ancylomarina subtilis]RZT97229.1 hypothetical protein EV201_1888 [Ancylomarina subtilis]